MTQAVVKSPVGGDYLSNQCKQFLQEKGIEIVPANFVYSKEAVKAEEPPVWERRILPDGLTESWKNFMQKVHKCTLIFYEFIFIFNCLSLVFWF